MRFCFLLGIVLAAGCCSTKCLHREFVFRNDTANAQICTLRLYTTHKEGEALIPFEISHEGHWSILTWFEWLGHAISIDVNERRVAFPRCNKREWTWHTLAQNRFSGVLAVFGVRDGIEHFVRQASLGVAIERPGDGDLLGKKILRPDDFCGPTSLAFSVADKVRGETLVDIVVWPNSSIVFSVGEACEIGGVNIMANQESMRKYEAYLQKLHEVRPPPNDL